MLIYNLNMVGWVRQGAVGKVSPDETLHNAGLLSVVMVYGEGCAILPI